MALAILNQILALAAIIVAVTFGAKAERYGAIVVALMVIIIDAGLLIATRRFSTVDPVALADDLIGFAGFTFIGISYKRIWPLWAAAFQLLSVGAHFVRALEIPVRPIVYAWMKAGPTWAVLALLILGSIVKSTKNCPARHGTLIARLIGAKLTTAGDAASRLAQPFVQAGNPDSSQQTASPQKDGDTTVLKRAVASIDPNCDPRRPPFEKFEISNVIVQRWVIGLFKKASHEKIHLALLDSDQRIIFDQSLSDGALDSVTGNLRTIVSNGINMDASGVVLMHNHPSGDPRPSPADIYETRRIFATLANLDLHLQDHLIVSLNRIFSMKGAKLL